MVASNYWLQGISLCVETSAVCRFSYVPFTVLSRAGRVVGKEDIGKAAGGRGSSFSCLVVAEAAEAASRCHNVPASWQLLSQAAQVGAQRTN